MAVNRKLFLLFIIQLLVVSIGGCQNNKINNAIEESKNNFGELFLIDSIFSHLPKNLKSSDFYSGLFVPPQKGSCFGEIFVGTKIDESTLKAVINRAYLKVDYLNSKKFLMLTHDLVSDSVFNTTHTIDTCFQYPIADFHQSDFYLGEIPDSTYLEDEKIYVSIPKYKTPDDLVIYLIDAQSGNFWKSKCTKFRSKYLGKWENGYSRGYAISEKEKIIIYWLVTW